MHVCAQDVWVCVVCVCVAFQTYPKRLDLWNVYIDKEVAAGSFPQARALLQRVTSMKWSSKKTRGLLKKWVEFEQRHGTARTVANVMQVAKRAVADRIRRQGGEDDDDDSSSSSEGDDDDDDDDDQDDSDDDSSSGSDDDSSD